MLSKAATRFASSAMANLEDADICQNTPEILASVVSLLFADIGTDSLCAYHFVQESDNLS